jgi:hypothetical protein
MIYSLNGGLASHAHFTAIDGVKRVSFDFNDAPFPVFGENAAARRALPANGSIPGRFSGYHIIRCVNQRIKGLIDSGGTACRKADASHSGDFQKGSTIHLQQLFLYRWTQKSIEMKKIGFFKKAPLRISECF